MHWDSAGLVKERWVKRPIKRDQIEADQVDAYQISEDQIPVLWAEEEEEGDRLLLLRANNTIRRALNSKLEDVELDGEIEGFLYNHWSRLLLKIYTHDSTEGQAWLHALQVVDDMVGYIVASQLSNRKQDLQDIYLNIKRVFKDGLELITVPKSDENKFFKKLASYCEDSLDLEHSSEVAQPFGAELLADNKSLNE